MVVETHILLPIALVLPSAAQQDLLNHPQNLPHPHAINNHSETCHHV